MKRKTNIVGMLGQGWAKLAMEKLGYKSRKTFYAHIKAKKPLVMNYLTPLLDKYVEEQKEALAQYTISKGKAELIKEVSDTLTK